MHETSRAEVVVRSTDRVPLRIALMGGKGRGVAAERDIGGRRAGRARACSHRPRGRPRWDRPDQSRQPHLHVGARHRGRRSLHAKRPGGGRAGGRKPAQPLRRPELRLRSLHRRLGARPRGDPRHQGRGRADDRLRADPLVHAETACAGRSFSLRGDRAAQGAQGARGLPRPGDPRCRAGSGRSGSRRGPRGRKPELAPPRRSRPPQSPPGSSRGSRP
jgi:hypothetical protein